MKDVRTSIVDTAEHLIRDGGYNGFSLEEIASELKLELFQVHEFFPMKGDLALAVAIRYTFNFLTALGEPSPPEGGLGYGTRVRAVRNRCRAAFPLAQVRLPGRRKTHDP